MRLEINLKIFGIIFLAVLFHRLDTYIIFLVFISVHELAHLLVGILIGGRAKAICLNPLGVSLDFYSYKKNSTLKKIILLLSGPMTNFIFAIIFMKYNFIEKYNEKIIYTNLVLAIFNLIPIIPLDGGKIMHEIIKSIYDFDISNKFMIIFSKTFLVIISLIYSVVILKVHNLFFLCVLIYLWILFIREERKYDLYIRVKKSLKGKC